MIYGEGDEFFLFPSCLGVKCITLGIERQACASNLQLVEQLYTFPSIITTRISI